MAANTPFDDQIKQIVTYTIEHISSPVNSKMDKVLEKQTEIGTQINKITDALYDPDNGLFIRTKIVEKEMCNLTEKISSKADKIDLVLTTKEIKSALEDCNSKSKFASKLWFALLAPLLAFFLGLLAYYLTSTASDHWAKNKEHQEVKLEQSIVPAIKTKTLN